MELYTDGSCITGPDGERYAGVGIWFGKNDLRNTSIPIDSQMSTNQYAELLAIRYALLFCKNVSFLVVNTDSKYSINCITVWCQAWNVNGWKTSTGKDVLYSSLIKECITMLADRDNKGHVTSLNYVKAHHGIEGNEGADMLAKRASSESCSKAMKSTIFFSQGILSQFSPSKFKADGYEIVFNCAEQWMHFSKAILFDDCSEIQQKIANSNSPGEHLRLGRQVKNFDLDIWEKERFMIVVKGNYYKFSQNPSLGRYLLSTGRKRLVEARDDTIWGIGITVAMARRGVKWNGTNLLGKALMQVRDKMLN
jgi:ribA/ribD-fused uncharacterized protein